MCFFFSSLLKTEREKKKEFFSQAVFVYTMKSIQDYMIIVAREDRLKPVAIAQTVFLFLREKTKKKRHKVVFFYRCN